MELVVVWMLFLPSRIRLICFFIVTPWEAGVILTANYTFLNYLVLSLGFLLLDDRCVRSLLPSRLCNRLPMPEAIPRRENHPRAVESLSILCTPDATTEETTSSTRAKDWSFRAFLRLAGVCVSAVVLSWIGYATTAEMIRLEWPDLPLPTTPVVALEPLRIANEYGLFAVMTRGRYEIEFQGSNDGQQWTPYLFRYKPQALDEAPGIYAPYQPRFEWNLWFASLGDWEQNNLVPETQERLLENDPDVLALFKGNPFAQAPPRFVRAVLWQYWFTSIEEKRRTGNWWRRNLLGLYAPVLTRQAGGKPVVVQGPDDLNPHD
jgi:hypothetical protein